ncbi:IclR family transcriptional regulator [Cytobacillus kochii]|uniref:IclR family transcriptional regulator n=1 Tax=Cytobacillus TaxID=2675230 RepID=UPI00278AF19B|nr:IclR family transcriptional regulator [Cytobacillus kochii]MDQ0184503.1 DNA-binding IclR family transcriptional regulator [Cytobacillus kochii]
MKIIEKMAKILSLYSMNRTSLSISEVQEELGYPKSTVFRILNALEEFDYIERNKDTHRYSLGVNFFRLGSIVQSQLDFRHVAIPIMKKMVEETSETVELNIKDDLNRVCVEKVDSPQDVRNFVRIGERKPLHLGASGKVLIAFEKETDREKTLDNLAMQNSLIPIQALREELNQINQRGFCVTKGERVPGSFAIAAPIFDQNKEMVASLTIAGPIQRLTPEHEEELIAKINEGARQISNNLGYFE